MSRAENPSADDAVEPERDERLRALLDAVAAEVRAGRAPDIERLAREHPDLADDLRALWLAVLVAEEVADSRRDEIAREAAGELPATIAETAPPGNGGFAPRTLEDYELLGELGRGGMGVVYKARQRSLDRVVAVKMMSRAALASPAERARFRAEGEAAARLDHPGIVPVYEVGEQAEHPYFTMKFVDGTTLARRLSDGPLPAREAAELLAAVARAVAFAHAGGVLHRDLKPSNVLIDVEGRPHVTDFGLAKRVGRSDLTASGAILGTPSYMSPEQASGRRGQVGPASDVFSLGAILYEALTGRPPFRGPTPADTVLMVLEQEPVPPRMLNPRVDRDLELIALKCLQKPPDLRYVSAGALADDLEAWLSNEPISARSGLFGDVVARVFRETHHATVLENWGLLWMLHSAALLGICLLTAALQARGTVSPWPYLGLWTAGLGAWAAVFWTLRCRAGPVTFIERQIAHVWAASMIGAGLLFFVEMILGLDALTLSPVLALMSGSVFLVKAAMLSGSFYVQTVVLYATALAMAWMQRRGWHGGLELFGVVSAGCFFVPGLKYFRQRRRAGDEASQAL